jgi:HK97 family phage major capsid protein
MSTEILAAVKQLAATSTKVAEHNQKLFDTLQDRIERVEAYADRPTSGTGHGTGESVEQKQYRGEFIAWLRKPHDVVAKQRIAEAIGDLQQKDVTIGTSAAGGYALPKQISSQIEDRVRQLNPIRQLARVDTTSSNDYRALVSMGDGSAGWVAETATRSATLTPTLRERVPTMGELYAYPQASNWALEDLAFNVQDWIVRDVSAEFGSNEATAFLTGNGSARPTGILNTTPVTTSDAASPMRAAGAIQYVGLQSFASPATINYDSLVNLVHTVQERYLAEADGVAFVMHRLTLSALQRLKASTAGTFLWGDMANGTPNTLLGYPVYTCDAMSQPGTDNFIVLFGNWKRGYLIADRAGMQITVDPYTNPGYTRFYVRKRVGGCILNNDAIKALRQSD